MLGTSLGEIRDHVEALASGDGTYYVVCGRTGDRPVPTAGLRFEERAVARNAARAAEQYRAALRRYDPRLPCHDLIVCQDVPQVTGTAEPERDGGPPSSPVNGRASTAPESRRLVEFCHELAAVVFETLCDAGFTAVETAVMDAYFDLAETVTDPDDLCLCLLESMAVALDEHLDLAEQATVLASAASQLPPPATTGEPVTATLTRLRRLGLLGSYVRSPWSADLAGGTHSVTVRLSGYALAPRDGRLPVLPVVLDLYRRRPGRTPSAPEVVDVDDGWRLTLTMTDEADPTALASAPIESQV
ncbi:DUF7551 domain-containing protein [Halomicrococcus gelatinilyticus]|uniref:DUF7551 domain-containing protein n=1 Tax=Halomicrococcus gelatinilyticus TaxID=1702103 RepID=UPI002E0DB347